MKVIFHYGVKSSDKAYTKTEEATMSTGGFVPPDPTVDGYVFKSWCPSYLVQSLSVIISSDDSSSSSDDSSSESGSDESSSQETEWTLTNIPPDGYSALVIDGIQEPAMTWKGSVGDNPMTVYLYTHQGKNCASKGGKVVEANEDGNFVWEEEGIITTIIPVLYTSSPTSDDTINFYAYYEEEESDSDDSSSSSDDSSSSSDDSSSSSDDSSSESGSDESSSQETEWETLEDIRAEVGIIPTPFATDPSAPSWFADEDSDSTEATFSQGFPDAFVTPVTNPDGSINSSGRVITRGMMNTLGYIGTQEQFFSQCGGYYTFDPEVCDAIGGYPESAILRYFDEDNNVIRTVYSLQNNNKWNFLTDGVDGYWWKYIDDNPSLSPVVDYSEFIDLSSTLFVETGIPDFFEVPYDSWLNLFSFSFCMMPSTTHISSEDVKALKGISANGSTGSVVLNYDMINGGQFTVLSGQTFLDIYNVKTNTTRSLVLRDEGCFNYGASIWVQNVADLGMRYFYKMPRYVVGQGTCFLNKGDKIRIRGVYIDKIDTNPDTGMGYESWHLPQANISAVHEMPLTDAEVQRYYLCKFANLYKVGWGE